MIFYIIGQPGSGKTTLALELVKVFSSTPTVHIDGDDLRVIFDNKDYSETGRRRNIERAQDIALFLHKKGYNVIVSVVSPYKEQRELFKDKMGDQLKEIYIHTSEIRGRENFFVEDYEKPTENYVDMCTDNITVAECIEIIFKKII